MGEADKNQAEGNHALKTIHEMPGMFQGMARMEVAKCFDEGIESKAVYEAFFKYYVETLKRPSAMDVAVMRPFHLPARPQNLMREENRLGNPACNFPIACAFGDQDFFASDQGAEEYLEKNKGFSGGKTCLFKVEKASHEIVTVQSAKLVELMKGFFDGELSGVWEPTVTGDYNWHGEKPKKGWVPRD